MIVTIKVPARGSREAFMFAVSVEGEYIISAPRGAEWMVGWHADPFRKFCRAVGWSAVIPRRRA